MTTKGTKQDTYQAAGLTLILIGSLYLIDKIISFEALGGGWIMAKDNFVLYAAVIFLLLKKDKTPGLIMAAIWALLNFGLVLSLLGSLSGYVLPVVLLAVGGALFYKSTR